MMEVQKTYHFYTIILMYYYYQNNLIHCYARCKANKKYIYSKINRKFDTISMIEVQKTCIISIHVPFILVIVLFVSLSRSTLMGAKQRSVRVGTALNEAKPLQHVQTLPYIL